VCGVWGWGVSAFLCDGPTIINVSGGRTSGFMLRRHLDAHGGQLPPDTHAVFCNTGAEHDGTLVFLAECADRWGVDLRWIERDASTPQGFREVTFETAAREHEPFEELITRRKFLPNAVMRFCTQALKIETAAAFMRAQGYARWTSVVGLRHDEPARVAKIRARDHGDWDVACPLYDARVTVADVAAYWRVQPFDLRIAAHEGNCVGCFLKSTGRRRRIAEDTPERLAWWAEMESRIGARFRKDGPSYARLLSDARAQGRLALRVIDDEDDLVACGCTDRRYRRCACRAPRTHGHALSCERSTWAA
jgi:3'-phosphoadenosine 5'-phosphosulfate sulfotransferase (PAPS reductase)/FAD synthetase